MAQPHFSKLLLHLLTCHAAGWKTWAANWAIPISRNKQFTNHNELRQHCRARDVAAGATGSKVCCGGWVIYAGVIFSTMQMCTSRFVCVRRTGASILQLINFIFTHLFINVLSDGNAVGCSSEVLAWQNRGSWPESQAGLWYFIIVCMESIRCCRCASCCALLFNVKATQTTHHWVLISSPAGLFSFQIYLTLCWSLRLKWPNRGCDAVLACEGFSDQRAGHVINLYVATWKPCFYCVHSFKVSRWLCFMSTSPFKGKHPCLFPASSLFFLCHHFLSFCSFLLSFLAWFSFIYISATLTESVQIPREGKHAQTQSDLIV